MKHHRLLSDARFADGLGQATTLTFGLLLLLALVWLGRLAILNSQLGQARTAVASRAAELDEAKKLLGSVNLNYRSRKPSSHAAVSELQSAIESAAAQRACIVSELTASPDAAPYISLYGAGMQAGWVQTTVKVTLIGRSPDVLDTLRSLKSSSLLLEIASLEMQRTEVDSSGDATVAAAVDIRLIRRQAA